MRERVEHYRKIIAQLNAEKKNLELFEPRKFARFVQKIDGLKEQKAAKDEQILDLQADIGLQRRQLRAKDLAISKLTEKEQQLNDTREKETYELKQIALMTKQIEGMNT